MFFAFVSVCNYNPILFVAQANTSSITGLSFEWADGKFTSLQVRWDPVTVPPGGGVTYRIRYSPIFALDIITCVGEASTSEAEETSILLTGLDPRLFYSVMVDAVSQDALLMLTGSGKSVYIHVHSTQFHAFIMQILGTIEVIVIRIHGCLCAEYSLVCMPVFTLVWCLIKFAGFILPACEQLQMLLCALALSLVE